jgi:hypothetical protein
VIDECVLRWLVGVSERVRGWDMVVAGKWNSCGAGCNVQKDPVHNLDPTHRVKAWCGVTLGAV